MNFKMGGGEDSEREEGMETKEQKDEYIVVSFVRVDSLSAS